MTPECIFCAIIAGTIPATIIDQTQSIIVIKDRAPKAPIHYLIIPKKHVQNCASLVPDDRDLAADILYMAQHLASTVQGAQDFRLLINNGAQAGQSVFHLHAHFIAGKTLTDF